MNLKKTTLEVLYKPYSPDIKGYILRMADFLYIVINSHLSTEEAAEVETKLNELSEQYPHNKLIILHGNDCIYKTDNLDFLERAC